MISLSTNQQPQATECRLSEGYWSSRGIWTALFCCPVVLVGAGVPVGDALGAAIGVAVAAAVSVGDGVSVADADVVGVGVAVAEGATVGDVEGVLVLVGGNIVTSAEPALSTVVRPGSTAIVPPLTSIATGTG